MVLVHPACFTPVKGMAGESCQASRLVNRLRNTNLSKFREYVQMHLSFLLDLPDDQLTVLFDAEPEVMCCEQESAKRKHFFCKRKLSKGEACPVEGPGLFGTPLTSSTMNQVLPLIEYLGRPENLQQEGLFRKSGQLTRQNRLREILDAGEDVTSELNEGVFSAHDVASLLKAYLAELPEPILQERYYEAYCQVLNMGCVAGLPEELMVLKRSKQLPTVQLLLQLLPRENLQLLERLLDLLKRVVKANQNKMSADALGTLLAPCILVPRKMSGSVLSTVASNITRVVSYMIDNADVLFQVPDTLVRDIAAYWEEVEEADHVNSHTTPKPLKHMSPSDAVTTKVSFVDRQMSAQARSHTDTEVALAQLYAHVSSMPESTQKKKLLKQFNKANSATTPSQTPHKTPKTPTPPGKSPTIKTFATPGGLLNSSRCSMLNSTGRHKRTRSLGESIKKIMSRRHKRQRSGHHTSFATDSMTSTPPSAPPCQVPIIVGNNPCIPILQGTPAGRLCAPPSTPCSLRQRLSALRDFNTPLLPQFERQPSVTLTSYTESTRDVTQTAARTAPIRSLLLMRARQQSSGSVVSSCSTDSACSVSSSCSTGSTTPTDVTKRVSFGEITSCLAASSELACSVTSIASICSKDSACSTGSSCSSGSCSSGDSCSTENSACSGESTSTKILHDISPVRPTGHACPCSAPDHCSILSSKCCSSPSPLLKNIPDKYPSNHSLCNNDENQENVVPNHSNPDLAGKLFCKNILHRTLSTNCPTSPCAIPTLTPLSSRKRLTQLQSPRCSPAQS